MIAVNLIPKFFVFGLKIMVHINTLTLNLTANALNIRI